METNQTLSGARWILLRKLWGRTTGPVTSYPVTTIHIVLGWPEISRDRPGSGLLLTAET